MIKRIQIEMPCTVKDLENFIEEAGRSVTDFDPDAQVKTVAISNGNILVIEKRMPGGSGD